MMPQPGPSFYKEITYNFECLQPIIEKFKENQIVNCLEQVTLRIQDGTWRNYMVVACITIDTCKSKTRADEDFYSSALNMYQLTPDKTKLKTCFVENYKRSITCVSSFLGRLVTTMKF